MTYRKLPKYLEEFAAGQTIDPRGEVLQRTLGLSSLAAGATGVSSPRLAMLAKQFSQVVVPEGLTRRLLSTGVEHQLIHGIADGVVDHDCEVLSTVQRYPGHGFEPPETVVFVRREGVDGVILDLIDLPLHQMTNTLFGVKNTPTEALRNIHPGTTLQTGTVLSAAPNRLPSGELGIGREANISPLSVPGVKEDGFVISKSFADSVKIPRYTSTSVVIGKNMVPLNLHGGDSSYKIVPEIGDKVTDEGLLMAMRTSERMSLLDSMSSQALKSPDYVFDSLRYVPPHATVVDIRVVRSGGRKPKYLTPAITQQLDYWHNQRTKFLTKLRAGYLSAIEETKRVFGKSVTIHESPALVARMSAVYRELEGGNNTAYVYRGERITSYWIEIITRVDLPLGKGYKMADLYGAKGVVCEIWPDENMPVDSRGVRADVIADGRASTFARMNPGRLHEQYIGAALRDYRLRLLEEFSPVSVSRLTESEAGEIQQRVAGLLRIINQTYGDAIALLKGNERRSWLEEVFGEAIYSYFDHRGMKSLISVVKEIEESDEYRPHFGHISYRNTAGRWVNVSLPTMIGSTTMIFIDKVADSQSGAAVNTPYMNGLGMPVKPGANARPIPERATKVHGEAESRATLAVTEPDVTPMISDIDLNPKSIQTRMEAIVESENPWQIALGDYEGIVPYNRPEEGTPPLMILHHLFSAMGVEVTKGVEHDRSKC